MIDSIADHYERIEKVPTLTDATPAEVAATFDDALPREGEAPEDILDDWNERAYP